MTDIENDEEIYCYKIVETNGKLIEQEQTKSELMEELCQMKENAIYYTHEEVVAWVKSLASNPKTPLKSKIGTQS